MVASPPPADLPTTGGALSIDQLCLYLGIRKTKVYAESKAGRLELRKAGSKTVAFRSEAERWLHALPTATSIEELERRSKLGNPRRSTSDVEDKPPANDKSDLGDQGADLDTDAAQ